VLLESGKFAQVCKIIEDLVGAKPPSARPNLAKEMKRLQEEVNINLKDLNELVDR
jgi:hypothetical protein